MKPDASGVGSGRDEEVMFQGPLVPVINQVDAGIDLLELDAGVLLHPDAPFGGVVAQEVAGMPGKTVKT